MAAGVLPSGSTSSSFGQPREQPLAQKGCARVVQNRWVVFGVLGKARHLRLETLQNFAHLLHVRDGPARDSGFAAQRGRQSAGVDRKPLS